MGSVASHHMGQVWCAAHTTACLSRCPAVTDTQVSSRNAAQPIKSDLVLEVAGVSDRGEEEVKGEKLEPVDVNVLVQRVQLDALVVVDVYDSALCCCEHGLVVQPGDVSQCLTHLHFTAKPACAPVERRNVSLAAANQKLAASSDINE